MSSGNGFGSRGTGREGLADVEALAGVQAVVETSEEPVEQVAQGCSMLVPGFAPTVVVHLDLRAGKDPERPDVAGGREPLVLDSALVHNKALAAGDGDRRGPGI